MPGRRMPGRMKQNATVETGAEQSECANARTSTRQQPPLLARRRAGRCDARGEQVMHIRGNSSGAGKETMGSSWT